MENDKLRKALGIDWQDKFIQPYKKIQELANPFNKILDAHNEIEKTLGIFGNQSFLNSFKAPNYAMEYLTTPTNKTHLMYNAIAEQASKANAINNILTGIDISMMARFEQKQTETEKTLALISGIKLAVLDNNNSYTSFLKISENISNVFYPSKSISALYSGNDLFKNSNFINNTKLTSIDILAGTTFSNLVSVSKSFGDFEKEIESLDTEILNNTEVKIEVQAFINNVQQINERTYKKIEEYLTDWIDKFSERFGISKQKSYYLAMILIFLSGVYVKDFLTTKTTPPIIYKITTIINPTAKKTLKYIVVKDASVYEKNHSTSRKIGLIKENTEVEIQRMKEGWCLVKGMVLVIKKQGKTKVEKDTFIQCWVNQRYLSNFQ